ncbi:MAG: STAS domain-containing protein [Odoribacteraceae bacterium]|jgi:anti-sigma B factor antagonist|nr:STAS domain-containing protein [Odoribacteraceae bacterium]
MNTASNTPREAASLLNITRQGNRVIAEFIDIKRFTLPITDQVKDELRPLLGDGGKTLIFDLHDIEFIDSSGIGCIIALLKTAKSVGSSLKLCDLTPDVMDIFKLLHLQVIFDISGTRADCLRDI